MAEQSGGPDWQVIIGVAIAGTVLLCIVAALSVLVLAFAIPLATSLLMGA